MLICISRSVRVHKLPFHFVFVLGTSPLGFGDFVTTHPFSLQYVNKGVHTTLNFLGLILSSW